MKTHTVISLSNMWSTKQLSHQVEQVLNEKTAEGYEIVSVSFGFNHWWMPTVYIIVRR